MDFYGFQYVLKGHYCGMNGCHTKTKYFTSLHCFRLFEVLVMIEEVKCSILICIVLRFCCCKIVRHLVIKYYYIVISYMICEQSNCWPEVEGIVFETVARVHNTIPDTEGQLFDCSKIPYEITVLLPDQLKRKERIQSFLQVC